MKMQIAVALLLAVVAPSLAFDLHAKSSLSFNADADGKPITKVVNLLKDMQASLEKEGEEDQVIYDSLVCWCQTNDKDKTKSIADGESRIDNLEHSIEELTAQSSKLNIEIAKLGEEVEKNQKALDKATGLRKKEIAEFMAEETDMLATIAALKGAVAAIGKNHAGALLQMQASQSQAEHVKLAAVLQHVMSKHADILQGLFTPTQKRMVLAFIDDRQPASAGSYAPASGAILGILKQMKEEFETNLAASQKEEVAGQADYESLKAAKETEIAAGKALIEVKTQELATTDENNAQAQQDLEDTTGTLAADQEFMVNLRLKCQQTDKEFELRCKDRQIEIGAVGKALAILSSDDARDLQTKTFGFVQVQATSHSQLREKASKLLSDVARKNRNPRLMALAVQVRLDAFVKVKQAIDDMVAELAKQKEDEILLKDFCTESFNENEVQTSKNTREKQDLQAIIDDLTMKIDELTKAIKTLEAEISEMQVQLKRAGENREKENKEFQQTVADQLATEKLLNKALDVLKGVYFLQAAAKGGQTAPAGPPPPPGFKKGGGGGAAAGGVMTMIQQIIDDAKAMAAEAIKGEEDATAAYEAFVQDTNTQIEGRKKEIVNKSEEKAVAEGDLQATNESHAKVMATLEELSTESADLHAACDFTLKNFDIRQLAKDQEIEALKQAKAILSGVAFVQFLQRM